MTGHVLVTGGLGFLGGSIVERLRACGAAVRVLDIRAPDAPRPDVKYVQGSVTDAAVLRQAMKGVHTVFHTAGKADLWAPNPDLFFKVNHHGTRCVCQEALHAGVETLVYTSTETILRDFGATSAAGLPSPDDVPGPYCRSKVLAEQEVRAAVDRGLHAVIAGPTVPIGPGDVNLTPPTRMLLGFLNGEYPAYLDAVLNLIDVRDVAAGHLQAARRGRRGSRYVLGHTTLRLGELLDLLREMTGQPMPRIRIPYWIALSTSAIEEFLATHVFSNYRPGASTAGVRLARTPSRADGSKAQRDLGFAGRPLRDTLADTIRWFVDQGLLARSVLPLR